MRYAAAGVAVAVVACVQTQSEIWRATESVAEEICHMKPAPKAAVEEPLLGPKMRLSLVNSWNTVVDTSFGAVVQYCSERGW